MSTSSQHNIRNMMNSIENFGKELEREEQNLIRATKEMSSAQRATTKQSIVSQMSFVDRAPENYYSKPQPI
jgi:hypothetical protein